MSTWKTLKGMAYATAFIALSIYAIQNGAPPLPTSLAGMAFAVVAMVGEVKEVEIANVLTLNFRH